MSSRPDDHIRESPPSYAQGRRSFFVRRLLDWGKDHFRDYPWRSEDSPYRLLLAEIMLRRTRADQVVDVYLRFLDAWPELESFLRATDEDLQELLRPLGLHWRIQNVIALRDALRGTQLEASYEDLMGLPGVGDYVASAVACFSTGAALPLIDTNSVRVLGRFFGFDTGPETRRRRFLRNLAAALVPPRRAVAYNYAILDLAALVCRHAGPDCAVCPLRRRCDYADAIQRSRY